MSKYKTEPHCHTNESSSCGKIDAKELVRAYIDAGYKTMVITDHYGFRHIGKHGDVDDVQHLLLGYREAKKAADGKINVILGMEISLTQHAANDYLVYGDIESVLTANPDMYNFDLDEFCEFAHNNNLVVYQAHPFRNNITVIDPTPLDGIEVFNSHPRHDSRNNIASAWAQNFGKKAISGSDTHQIQDIGRSGIRTDTEIKTADDLLAVLSGEEYELILI